MPRHAGLIDVHGTNQVTHGLLAIDQSLDDAKPCWVRQHIKHVLLHHDAYVCVCIFRVKNPGKDGLREMRVVFREADYVAGSDGPPRRVNPLPTSWAVAGPACVKSGAP